MKGYKTKPLGMERITMTMSGTLALNLSSGLDKLDDKILAATMTVVEYRTFKLFMEELKTALSSSIIE